MTTPEILRSISNHPFKFVKIVPPLLLLLLLLELVDSLNFDIEIDVQAPPVSGHDNDNRFHRKLIVAAARAPNAEDIRTLLVVKAEFANGEEVLTDWSNSSTASACNWTAVTCGGPTGDRVIGLNLGGQNLRGIVPPSLGRLPFLQQLNLSTNSLGGPIPSSLGNCTRLVYLNLVANNLEGKIPFFGDPSTTFRELEYLNLGRNKLTGPIPDWLGEYPSLGRLGLYNNALTGGIPTKFGQLSKLRILYLSLNDLSGTVNPSIANCSSLVSLALDMNDFGGPIPSELGELQNLENLYLGTNQFTGQVPVAILTNCTNLKILLFENNDLTGQIPPEVGRLQMLETLYMRGNKLTGKIPLSFVNCTNLSWLSLDDNQLSGDVPREFGLLKSLTSLNLWNNNLTNSLPASLANCTGLYRITFGRNDGSVADGLSLTPQPFPAWITSLVNMSFLELMTVGLYGPIPASLSNCSLLMTLHLPYNNLTGPIPEALGDLTFLEDVILTGNQLSGHIPKSIGNLSSLWRLHLDENHLEGQFPPALRDSLVLEELKLGSNQLSGEIPSVPGFWSHPNLNWISLEGNEFNGTIQSAFGNLPALIYLDVSSNKLTGPIPSALGTMSPLLSDLILNDNHLSGSIPIDLFTGCPLLEKIQFQSNDFGGSIPDSIGDLGRLTSLDLSSNNFSGVIPSFSRMTSLNEMNLSWNQFSGSLTEGGFLDLPDKTLVSVDLSHNNFSGPLPQELSSLKGLQLLDLSVNNFSGTIPEELAQLEGLSYFNVSFNQLEGPIPTTGVFARMNLTGAFLGNPKLCGSVIGRNCSESSDSGGSGCRGFECKGVIVGVICAGTAILFLIVMSLIWCRFCYNREATETYADASIRLNYPKSDQVLKLSAESLKRATENFAAEYLIGEGAGTRVYKVVIPESGQIFAAKVVPHAGASSKKHEKHLLEEFHTLSKLRHRNVLRVLGFCSSPELKAAILEYMANGSLHNHLHGQQQRGKLSWESRLNIAVGMAHGLVYLHEEFPEPIIHRDLKPMNVLLDHDLEPKICDFGLGKFVYHHEVGEATATALCGTIGYIPPEYTTSTRVSTKGDVYAYGIILLELLTGRQPTEKSFGENEDLVTWAQSSASIVDILDLSLVPHVRSEGLQLPQLTLSLQVALLCCQSLPQSRPSMRDVLGMLLQIKEPNLRAQIDLVKDDLIHLNVLPGIEKPTRALDSTLVSE